MRRHLYILWLTIFFLSTSCSKWFLGSDPGTSPPEIFDLLWKDFDRYYAFFELKNINWDSLYALYRPQVTEKSTNAELFITCVSLLQPLKDGHVKLDSSPVGSFSYKPWETPHYVPYNQKVVISRYLQETARFTGSGNLLYGRILGSIGYLHIQTFSDDDLTADDFEVIDTILKKLQNSIAMIVDIRDNVGGNPAFAKIIASRFADQKRLFSYTRYRSGPAHSDFGDYIPNYVEPAGAVQFKRPVILLTNRATFSAAEYFVLAMRSFPNVTIIGDTTGGGFGIATYRELPNGWIYRLPHSFVVDADSVNYEGVGISPDILIVNTREDELFGTDTVLSKAIKFIRE